MDRQEIIDEVVKIAEAVDAIHDIHPLSSREKEALIQALTELRFSKESLDFSG